MYVSKQWVFGTQGIENDLAVSRKQICIEEIHKCHYTIQKHIKPSRKKSLLILVGNNKALTLSHRSGIRPV